MRRLGSGTPRVLLLDASTLILPALMCSRGAGSPTKATSISPASSACTTREVPLYGTCVAVNPASFVKCTIGKCVSVPTPSEP